MKDWVSDWKNELVNGWMKEWVSDWKEEFSVSGSREPVIS